MTPGSHTASQLAPGPVDLNGGAGYFAEHSGAERTPRLPGYRSGFSPVAHPNVGRVGPVLVLAPVFLFALAIALLASSPKVYRRIRRWLRNRERADHGPY
jgi:hypothetical protein